MKPMTAEWVAKAEGDFNVLEREARVRIDPNYDAPCFHAQQCAEKYLKALLCEADVSIPKVHYLVVLLDILLPLMPTWECYREDLAFLTNIAVGFHYPSEFTDKASAMDARTRCRRVRRAARAALLLEG